MTIAPALPAVDDPAAPASNGPADRRRPRPPVQPTIGATPMVGVVALAEPLANGLHRPVPRAASVAAAEQVVRGLRPGEHVEVDEFGDLVVHLVSRSRAVARQRLLSLSRGLVATPLETSGGPVALEVGAGVVVRRGPGAQQAEENARAFALSTLTHRDLVPRPDIPNGRVLRRWSTPSGIATATQVVLAVALTFAVPFLVMVGAYQAGVDISRGVYIALVVALASMAVLQWSEAIQAMGHRPVPPVPDRPAPPASALIAAYLPNEAATIVETVRVFLAQEYPGELQVVLAYNTPRSLPVEDELAQIAADDPRLVLLRVPGSTSKAQNINAALHRLTGEIVGIFDADHHPSRGAFLRAWRWIADGVDIVQGHCVIRNGDDSRVARLVATEFEQIYALSHPGRQRLHGFGVFGGSNGFWRAEVLRATRFRTDFLTEDIEASVRAVRDGRVIVNDPGLVSRELAPETLKNLWRQRMRWAQGWLQVSIRHAHAVLRPGEMPAQQRFGLGVLLLWREVFPWFSSLMWPLLAFFVWRDGGLALGASIWWLTTVYTMSAGPVQVIMARRLSVPEIRRRTSWWWMYGFSTVLFYAEWKNLISRVAQLKQLVGEHQWVVTPRTAPAATTTATATAGATR